VHSFCSNHAHCESIVLPKGGKLGRRRYEETKSVLCRRHQLSRRRQVGIPRGGSKCVVVFRLWVDPMNRSFHGTGLLSRDEGNIYIRVFKNGYIVDGEEFCPKDDTEDHKQFYESVAEGYVPRVLESAVRDQGKKVVVEDRRKEDYVAPPSRFSGKGNRIQDSIPLPITPRTKLSDKRLHYIQSKPKAGVRVVLSSGVAVILEVTEDWDNEDIYAAVQAQGNASAWELHDGYHDHPIPCNHTKVFRAGYGGSSIR
ncbi:hypothetical protein WA538_000261, partial [Blastocystis sp. DL]